MAENESEASRYESKYGGNHITPAQRIAEIMCERLAQQNKVTLPVKFWNTKEWKKVFMLQVLTANSLLKKYHPEVIFAALRKMPKVYSLRAKWLIPILNEETVAYKKKIESIKATPETVVSTTEKPREAFSTGKSSLSKLREL